MAIAKDILRSQLKDFRTRSDAIRDAIQLGGDAVDTVIDLLHDRAEAIRWSAIRILRDIGDTRAVGALIACMDMPGTHTDCIAALRVLTGQDFGEDAVAWRRWAAGEVGVEVPAGPSEMSDEELVRAAIKDLYAKLIGGKGRRFSVKVEVKNGRSQRVYVDFGAVDADDQPMVRIYTRCGHATPDRFEWALKRNLRMPYGALAITEIEGSPYFVMFNTHLRATVDPEDIAKSIITVAERGDRVEQHLSNDDRH